MIPDHPARDAGPVEALPIARVEFFIKPRWRRAFGDEIKPSLPGDDLA